VAKERLSHPADFIPPEARNTYQKACSENVNPHLAERVDRDHERYIPSKNEL
jgi:hypothetical protein